MNDVYWSNQKSILQHILKERDVNPYIYDYNNNFSDGIKTSHFIYPSVAQYSYGDIVYFNIPSYGYLSKAFIEINITLDAEYTLGQENPAEKFFEWIEVRTTKGDETLQRFTDIYTMMRTDLLDQGTYSRMSALLSPVVTDDTNHVYRMYVPIYAYFSEHPSKFFNTELLEPITIVAKINKDNTTIGIQQAITKIELRLHATYFKTEENTIQRLPLTYVVAQAFEEKESSDITTGTSSYNGVFEVERSVFATHFLLENANRDIKIIKDVTIKVNGRILYTSNYQLNGMELGWYGTSGFTIDTNSPSENLGQRAFSIYWSMYSDRNRNTLMINFKDCKPVEYEITFDAIQAGDDPPYKLKIIQEYFDILKVDGEGNFERRIIY